MKYDTVFPAFADRVVSRLAAIGAVGAAAGVVFHILFFLYMKQRYIHWKKEKRDAAYIGQMGAALAGSRLFVEAGLAAAVVLWTPLSILGFLAGLLSLFPATIWARQ